MYVRQDFQDPVGSYEVLNEFEGKILNHHVIVDTIWVDTSGDDPTVETYEAEGSCANRRAPATARVQVAYR